MKVLEALASNISTCSLRAILLSKITARYFILLTKVMFRPINVMWALGGSKSEWKIDGLSLNFIDSYVQTLTPSICSTGTSLQISEKTLVFVVCRIYSYTGVRRKHTWYLEHIYIYTIQYGGEKITFSPPCLSIHWRRKKSANKLQYIDHKFWFR
jgi:hypothetical protein